VYPRKEPLLSLVRVFYRPDAVSVTQSTVSSTERKQR